MDTRTGEIVSTQDIRESELRSGRFTPLSKREHTAVEPLPPHMRMAHLKRIRREDKKRRYQARRKLRKLAAR